jgi:diguanylate cyclase (GGDEF)-like protein
MRKLLICIYEVGWHSGGNEVESGSMTNSSPNDLPPSAAHALAFCKPEIIRENLQHLDRRQWWLGSTTVAVVLLLTVCVASFAFPGILRNDEGNYAFYLNQAVRALVGLVLLFSVYLIYQQFQISKLRSQLGSQIDSLAKVESLASEVYKLAALDQLTGLYNRRSGEQRLAEEISRAQRHGRPLTVLLMDLDGLKIVNDQFGHAAGDTVIKSFADRLQRAIRGSDLAVRLGGDEFMAILPECRGGEVKHVLGRIEGLDFEFDDQKVLLRFSSGWTDYTSMETMQEFLKRADMALYVDKRAAKGGSHVNSPQPVPVP